LHFHLSQKSLLQSNGDVLSTFYKYSGDYDVQSPSDSSVIGILALQQAKAYDVPIEIITKRINETNLGALSGLLFEYNIIPSAPQTVVPKKYFTYESTTFSDIELSRIEQGLFLKNQSYILDASFNYDSFLNPKEVHKRGEQLESIVWGYSESLPIARVIGFGSDHVACTSFEDASEEQPSGNGSMIFKSSGINYYSLASNNDNPFADDARTGERSIQNVLIQSQVMPAGEYMLSFWVKGEGTLYINGAQSGTTIDTEGWILINEEVLISNPSVFSVRAEQLQVDEIRISPVQSLVTTFTYSPLFGITSSTDPNNVTTYYKYDKLGRLSLIIDNDNNVVKSIKYNYKTDN
jgi:YD repeat-containing protein